MNIQKTLFALLIFSLGVVSFTGGQSLVMSGNEVFEQESIPKKNNKNTQQKNIKQKGIIDIPIFKSDKNSINSNSKGTKIIDNDSKKSKNPTTLSTAQFDAPYENTGFIVFLTLHILAFLYRTWV